MTTYVPKPKSIEAFQWFPATHHQFFGDRTAVPDDDPFADLLLIPVSGTEGIRPALFCGICKSRMGDHALLDPERCRAADNLVHPGDYILVDPDSPEVFKRMDETIFQHTYEERRWK